MIVASRSMGPLRVLILSDGRPGHFHLSEGIAAAAGRLRPTEVVRVEVRRRGWPGRLLAAMVNAGVRPAAVLRIVYGLTAEAMPASDLIISAGAQTLAANICLARMRKVPNVFYGSLRAFRPEDFALVLTSYARQAERPRHALALKPSRLDPNTLPPPGIEPPGPARPPRTAGLLVGGDSGAFRYTSEDWSRVLDFVAASHRQDGTGWIVSNSRRSPPLLSDEIAVRARDTASGIVQFMDVRGAGASSLSHLFAQAEAIVCTDDSSSMVSEAVWARRPVLGISPRQHAFTADERDYRKYLMDGGWYRSLPIADLAPARFLEEVGSIRTLAENPLDRLAALLRERIPAIAGTTGNNEDGGGAR